MLDYGPGSAGLSGPGTARCRADYAEAGPTCRAGCHGRAGEKGRDPCRANVHKMAAREIKRVPLLCAGWRAECPTEVGRRVRGRACVRVWPLCGLEAERPVALSRSSRSLAIEHHTNK